MQGKEKNGENGFSRPNQLTLSHAVTLLCRLFSSPFISVRTGGMACIQASHIVIALPGRDVTPCFVAFDPAHLPSPVVATAGNDVRTTNMRFLRALSAVITNI